MDSHHLCQYPCQNQSYSYGMISEISSTAEPSITIMQQCFMVYHSLQPTIYYHAVAAKASVVAN